MKVISVLLLLTCAALLQGCSYPEPAKVVQKDARPALGVSGAPEGSLLFVDGLHMGFVSQYDGKAGVLLVESGNHLVEIRSQGGETLFSRKIFLSGSTTEVISYNP